MRLTQDQKNWSIEVLLEYIIGDYLPVLVEVGGLIQEDLNVIADAICEIGRVFDVEVMKHDVYGVLTRILQDRTGTPTD